jgi:integrase/recombinase XerC
VTVDLGPAVTDPLLAAYLQWMGDRALSPRTVESRTSILRMLTAYTGKPLAEVTPEDLAGWQRHLATKLTPRGGRMQKASRHVYLKQTKALFRWARDRELIAANPAHGLVLPVLRQGKPRPVGEDDLELALAAANDRVRVWLLLAGLAGLRAIEISQVERSDVLDALPQPLLRVRGKGDVERWVPLSPPVLAALRPFLSGSGRLFWRVDGTGPVTAPIVSQLCNRHLRMLAIPSSLHTLRHRFGTTAYRATRDLRVVQGLMGHSSPITTSQYVQPDGDVALAAVLAAASVNR